MKSLFCFLSLLISISPLIAQDTNAIATKASAGITSILETYSTVKNANSYNAANTRYKQQIAELLPLVEQLKKAAKPTREQTQAFVVTMVNQEQKLSKIMTKLSKNQQSTDQKIRGLLRLALNNFNKDIAPLVAQLDRLYPKSVIDPLVAAERKRQGLK